MYSLQYPSLNEWKIVGIENQSNSNLSYNIGGIDNNNYFDNGYNFIILHIENNLSTLKISLAVIPPIL